MNGKQLKNSILQWAIQGKLVPQDPNDEPASVLLERIRTEKAKLVKEKKIKKDKNESIIYRGEDNSYYEKFLATGEIKCIDEEIPFEIPATWEWARFSTIVNMSPTVLAEDDVNAAFMPMALINAGYSSGYSYETKKAGAVSRGGFRLYSAVWFQRHCVRSIFAQGDHCRHAFGGVFVNVGRGCAHSYHKPVVFSRCA